MIKVGHTALTKTMLETIRDFGLEQLAEHGETQIAREDHARYYLASVEAADRERQRAPGTGWRTGLELEHDNLRAALRWTIDDSRTELALRFVSTLWRFWSESGHLSEGRRWVSQALELTDTPLMRPDLRARAFAGAAKLACDQGAYDEAEGYCAQARDLAVLAGVRPALVLILNIEGILARERGRYEESARRHTKALRLAETQDDRSGVAAALTGLAYASMFSGDMPRSLTLSERAAAVLRDGGDQGALADALVAAAAQAIHAGAYARAEAFGSEALDLSRADGDTGQIAEARWVLAVAAQFQGQYERAKPLYQECWDLHRHRGDELRTVQPLTALATIALHDGDYLQARTLTQQTLMILKHYDDPWALAMSLVLLGHVELADGHIERAEALFNDSAPLSKAIRNPLYLPWRLEGLAGIAAARGLWEDAAYCAGVRDAVRGELGVPLPPVDPARHARVLGEIIAALGDDGFARCYDAGRSLSLDHAIAAGIKIIRRDALD